MLHIIDESLPEGELIAPLYSVIKGETFYHFSVNCMLAVNEMYFNLVERPLQMVPLSFIMLYFHVHKLAIHS